MWVSKEKPPLLTPETQEKAVKFQGHTSPPASPTLSLLAAANLPCLRGLRANCTLWRTREKVENEREGSRIRQFGCDLFKFSKQLVFIRCLSIEQLYWEGRGFREKSEEDKNRLGFGVEIQALPKALVDYFSFVWSQQGTFI